jgi:hypothetical protein
MSAKSVIFQPTTVTHFAELHRLLRSHAMRQFITKTQGDEIAHCIDERATFPATVMLEQRTPKGTVYVHINGTPKFTIDQRGAFGHAK